MRGCNGYATGSVATSIANSPPPFLSKTYDMVDDPSTDSIVSWGKNGNSFVVWNDADCALLLLPNYFKHKNFSSFVRQLNTYGFRKIESDRWEFANEGFLRGQKHLLKSISRRKPAHVQQSPQQPTPVQSTSAPSSVEVARFEIEEDVQYLKKDKNVIMQELVMLRQQQQATDQKLQTVGHRVHIMEQKQQQMMSFLAKAMQSPGFLSQLLHQQKESKTRISVGSKKRRLPNQEEEILVGKYGSPSPDGQIVNYQPSMNEAAKAMLQQILKINASTRLEPKINHANGFLIADIPSTSNALNMSNCSGRISGVTLSEVLPTPVQSHAAVSVSRETAAICEARPSPCLASGAATVTPFPEMNVPSTKDGTLPYNFSDIQGIIPESPTEGPDSNFMDPTKTNDMEYMDIISGFEDGEVPVLGDDFSLTPDTNVLVDENPKLPSINDVFWEQFLSASPLLGDVDEHNSLVVEGVTEDQDLHTGPETGWDGTKNMNHLTEQMGFLASETVAV